MGIEYPNFTDTYGYSFGRAWWERYHVLLLGDVYFSMIESAKESTMTYQRMLAILLLSEPQ